MIEVAHTAADRTMLLSYLAAKIGTTAQGLIGEMPFQVVAVTRSGQPIGAVLYNNFRGASIEVTCAGEPGWCTRSNLHDLFAYPFLQLKCWTVLTMIKRSNRVTRDFNRKLGFTELCVIATGIKSEDTIMYGMERPACRWITKEELARAA